MDFTMIPLLTSLILFSLADFCGWRYSKGAKIIWSDISKAGYLLTLACFIWLWACYPFHLNYALAWIFLHFPIHQVTQGFLRHRQPLYLGVGIFDRAVRFLTGNQWWFYLIALCASGFVGIHLLIKT